MSWNEDLRILLEGKLKNEFLLFPNSKMDIGGNTTDFKPPIDKSPWLRSTINILDGQNAEIGTKFQRIIGDFVIQCFDGEGKGEKNVNEAIDELVKVFQNKSFSSVNCFVVVPVTVGKSSGWFQRNAKIRFTYNIFS